MLATLFHTKVHMACSSSRVWGTDSGGVSVPVILF